MIQKRHHSVAWFEWPRIRFELFGYPVHVFHACGVAGLAIGTSLTLVATALANRSILVVLQVVLVALATSLALACATSLTTGGGQLVAYHHIAAVLVSGGFLLTILDQPVLAYLDLFVLGLGAFLVCGRVGCFMVGCCYGRPSSRGVSYRLEHALEGFPVRLVNVTLAPVQLIEAGAIGFLVVLCVDMLVRAQVGTPLVAFLAGYAAIRFFSDYLRGDSYRAKLLGLTEAQWTSLGLAGGIVVFW